MPGRRAVFLDRDGTLIRDVGYLSDPWGVELLPGVIQALGLLRKKGLALVLASNQSGVGRGLFTERDLDRIHDRLIATLAEGGIRLDGAYYCPHAPWDLCECRKPLPRMLHQAAQELGLDLAQSFMVGDKLSDMAAGRRAGCRTVLLLSDVSKPDILSSAGSDEMPDKVAPDLLAAEQWIISQLRAVHGLREGHRVG